MRRLISPLVAAALLLLGGAAPAIAEPLIAAHRGGALLWPENSLLAYRNALALGADFLETDIHLTADGEVVVLHDPTLDRTTTGTGPVSGRRLAELAPLRLRAADGTATDEPVPTLGQLLDLVAPSRAKLLLEIKVDAARRPYAAIEDKALALVRARGLTGRVLVMAFEPDTLRRVRALDPAIPVVLLVSRARMEREGGEAMIRQARELRATHLGVDHRALDAALVAAVRAAGLTSAAWTVNTEPDLRRIIDLGVDVVISDRPDLARQLGGR
jgi:glycerophosphoryl diester phosphodiesterase